MKKILKAILAIILVLTMILSGTVTAFGGADGGIGVQLNGEDLVTDAPVKNVNGNTVIPFRQLLETLGATVTYDAATKTVSAKTAATEITFTVGSADVTVTDASGTTSVKKMSVAPFIDRETGKTYVPVRFFAESLGYCVGWDAENKTVVIIDPATLFGTANEDFSIISLLMKSDLDLEKPYEVSGSFDVSAAEYADAEAYGPGLDFSVTGKYTGIQQKSDAEMAMSLAFDFADMLKSMDTADKEAMEPMLAMFDNATMDVKMDGEAGVIYMNSSLFTAIDPTMEEDTWYKMDVNQSYADAGINLDVNAINQLSYAELGIEELLTVMLTSSQDSLDVDTYQSIKAAYAFCKDVFGDEAFQTKTAGTTSTHTLKVTQTSLIASITKTALSEGISDDMISVEDLKELKDSKINTTLVIKETAGSLKTYDLKGSFSLEGAVCSFDFGGDQLNMDGQMTIDMEDIMKVTVKAETHISETTKTPDVNPPADAKIVDFPAY